MDNTITKGYHFSLDNFKSVYDRIRDEIKNTPCTKSQTLSKEIKGEVFLKLENLQKTGSFKIRGVANKILSLNKEDLKKKLIAASTGNHGNAFAYLVNKFNLKGELYVPENINPAKKKSIEEFDIPINYTGLDCIEAELKAEEYSKKENSIPVKPYNDQDIILGQGTIALELIKELKNIDIVFVPVGGGGLISGIAKYLKQVSPKIKIIACQPENSPIMYRSIKAGHIVEEESFPTLADATAGGIEPNSITFDICKDLVDEFILLSEEEILAALRYLHLQENVAAEGGSAMTLAAMRKKKKLIFGKKIVLIISGGKISNSLIELIGAKND